MDPLLQEWRYFPRNFWFLCVRRGRAKAVELLAGVIRDGWNAINRSALRCLMREWNRLVLADGGGAWVARTDAAIPGGHRLDAPGLAGQSFEEILLSLLEDFRTRNVLVRVTAHSGTVERLSRTLGLFPWIPLPGHQWTNAPDQVERIFSSRLRKALAGKWVGIPGVEYGGVIGRVIGRHAADGWTFMAHERPGALAVYVRRNTRTVASFVVGSDDSEYATRAWQLYYFAPLPAIWRDSPVIWNQADQPDTETERPRDPWLLSAVHRPIGWNDQYWLTDFAENVAWTWLDALASSRTLHLSDPADSRSWVKDPANI